MTCGQRSLILAGVLFAMTGCAYYNAMWSAERFAKQARRAEASGQEIEARGLWGRAAVKAESVVARHPKSRWADDAIVLRAEALVRTGGCAQAAAPLARAQGLELDGELRERTDLAAAECALTTGRAGDAAALLAPLIESHDAGRRARATYLAGRAAWARGDAAGAVELLGRSTHPAAAPVRVRVLLAAGRTAAALALLDSLDRRRFDEAEWTELLDSTAAAASPAAASQALDHLLLRGRVPADAAARLLRADGDRRSAALEVEAAAARYAAAARRAPDAALAEDANVRRLRIVAAGATSLADLDALTAAVSRIRGGAVDYRGLGMTLTLIRQRESDVGALRGAELARDSLHAERLAANLFLDVVARWPGSVFAPKALVAAMALLPERRDSLAQVLDARYAGSPYALALRGGATPAFTAAEDSLARALGLALAVDTRASGTRVAAPVPGPRSVALDPPIITAGAPTTTTPVRRPPPTTPGRPAQRPVDRP